jgi:hypothetical protein
MIVAILLLPKVLAVRTYNINTKLLSVILWFRFKNATLKIVVFHQKTGDNGLSIHEPSLSNDELDTILTIKAA